MSSVSYECGDVSWTDSYTCDRCGAKEERRGPFPENKPTVDSPIPHLKRKFDPGAFAGWSNFDIVKRESDAFSWGTNTDRYDFCASCTSVILEHLKTAFKVNDSVREERVLFVSSHDLTVQRRALRAKEADVVEAPVPPEEWKRLSEG